ncbi:SLATT domain-containing protein [Streptomyces sp. NPDC088725]|uniref:SLATT domain-containing protein n=1 Tax=Streptomyces sp. NPDC088725 TaxID=3365873 RepID=UPI0037F9C569
MSQPEMQPGGPSRDGGPAHEGGTAREEGAGPLSGANAGAVYGEGGPPSGDLTGGPFPLGDWGEPAVRLDELYRWVETGALRTVGWYLAERARKRRYARVLRAATALGIVSGAALPLLDLIGALGGASGWGYLLLLLGAASLACDKYFGLTSGWMRAVAAAQAVQRRLQTLQFDWASECVREVLGPTEGTASEAAERCLGVLRKFTEEMTELVRAETADWMTEFHSGHAPLVMQSVPMGGTRTGGTGAMPGRFPFPPGARPNMPRQRPPEPR